MTTRVAIVGVSGYSGLELCRILLADPRFTLTAAFSDRCKGEPVARLAPALRPYAASPVVVRPQAEAKDAWRDAEVVLLATPAEVSAELAPILIANGARVIDLSGAFRLRDLDVFRSYYKFVHPAPELVAEAHYGLPQVPGAEGDAPPIAEARLVANPGCYATAAILSLAPLCAAKLIEPRGVCIDGKSGVSGAGRKLAEAYLYMELGENVAAYRVANHQHTPEIEQALGRVAGAAVTLSFVPHLLPIKRGLITTSFARAAAQVPELRALYARYYEGSDVVRTGSVEEASIASVAETPDAQVGAQHDPRTGQIVAACALDNLLKGAASQAHENLLRMTARARG